MSEQIVFTVFGLALVLWGAFLFPLFGLIYWAFPKIGKRKMALLYQVGIPIMVTAALVMICMSARTG